MTVAPSIDPARLLEEAITQTSPDLVRHLLGTVVNTLMSAAGREQVALDAGVDGEVWVWVTR
jgi:hypothetical protein